MQERTTRLVVCVRWLALTTISLLAFPFASASATTLTPQNSGHCLSVVQDANELLDGARIEQRACNGASRQNWTLEDFGASRQFRAKVLSSGKCLQPVDDPVINGTELEQRACDGSSKQQWTREATTVEGTYRFHHVASSRCMDVPQRSTVEGVHIILWDCHPDVRPQQSWAIAQRVTPKHALGKCLDVRGGPQQKDDNAVIDQWTCNEGAWNQFWTVRDMGTGQVKLVAQNSGKCLQPLNGDVADLTQIVQMTCSDTATTQLWTLQTTATAAEYKLVHGSGKCIDIKQSLQTDGAEALLFTCKTTNDANQRFQFGTAPTIETILSGEYWSLPARYPAKSPNGGLHQLFGGAARWKPILDMVYLGGYWRDLNPNDGDYNRPRFEDGTGTFYGLNELAAQGKTGIIWINAIGFDTTRVPHVMHTPDWLITKCGSGPDQAVTIPQNGTPGNDPWGVSMWNDCPKAEMVKFIRTMFTPYKNDPAIKYAYVTTFNASEFFIQDNVYTWAKDHAGLTPQKLEAYAKALIDVWVEVLGPERVVWMRANDDWKLPVTDPTEQTTPSRVNDYALITKGVQMREGNAENFMANLDQPLINQGVLPVPFLDQTTPNGQHHWYLTAKTIYDMLPTPRTFYGDEFEVADKGGAPTINSDGTNFVPGNYPYYRLAVLNMLRKGQNWTTFSKALRDGDWDQDPRFTDYVTLRNYFRQSAGYAVTESPDAWVTLHETNDSCFNGRRHYHNYEKFLHQIEQTGGLTQPALPLQWPANTYAFTGCLPATTQFAKRTDWASGNNYIYFDLDDTFATSTEHRFRIAVTYQDTGTNSWRVDYNSTSRPDAPTPSVTNTNTNAVKTVIFSLKDASFQNALDGQKDFRISNMLSNTDVVIRSVRVLRGDP
ncbi:MAG TPA: ricin-type beta-trefoil lectin domain protein [Steroidobacteraceae bacterium]|nr:ricin-type beta-trefoil lectin domain protein [Steroidobacteraceae bacterium]